jgi:hypothetical protein
MIAFFHLVYPFYLFGYFQAKLWIFFLANGNIICYYYAIIQKGGGKYDHRRDEREKT